jgi:DNA-binding NtrC family response regulator
MSDDARRARVLVIDDEPTVCRSCEKILVREGHEVVSVPSGREGLERIGREAFDIVITDLKMAEMGGMEVLDELRTSYPDVVRVVVTGYPSIASVVESMRLGAFDYLAKPFTPQELATVVAKAWDKRQSVVAAKALAWREMPSTLVSFLGRGEWAQAVYQLIRKGAPTPSTVLIVGENGTGKEAVARAIHALSPREHGPFVALDCAMISPELLGSELFGYVKGAFPEADADEPGVFDAADAGSVLLDDISHVRPEIQDRLLELMQEREFVPVGGNEPVRADVRLLFATGRELESMVTEGLFSAELYRRMSALCIRLPPLRERREDIALLAASMLATAEANASKKVHTIAAAALRLLELYDWPGNVTQLESVIDRAVIACEGDVIEPRHLPEVLTRTESPSLLPVPRSNQEFLALKRKLREQAVAELEREFLLQALERNAWNVTRAAHEVGIQRPNFQALMRKHGLKAGAPPGRETL